MSSQARGSEARGLAPSHRSEYMRALGRVVLLLVTFGHTAACALSAAPRANLGSWDHVLRLRVGEQVEVARWDSPAIRGKLAEVDAAAVAVRVPGGTTPARVPRAEIRRLQTITGNDADSVRNGALIGAAVGAAYVVAVLTYIGAGGEGGEPAAGNWLAGPPLGAAAGAGIGALIDSMRSGPRKVTVFVGRR